MKRTFPMMGCVGGIVTSLYVGSYFASVREGGPRTALGLSINSEYQTTLSEQHAERLFYAIHIFDRKWLRPEKWGDRAERMFTEPRVPQQAIARLCGLHHKWRTNATVPIIYGLVDLDSRYIAAEQQTFPNSWKCLYGGCVSGKFNGISSPTQAVVRVCPGCREAEQKWKSERQAL